LTRNKSEAYDSSPARLQDAVGELVHLIGIVETLANAAATLAGRVGEDRIFRRRLSDLAIQIENAAHDALVAGRALDTQISAMACP
jgi:hypothetical protein